MKIIRKNKFRICFRRPRTDTTDTVLNQVSISAAKFLVDNNEIFYKVIMNHMKSFLKCEGIPVTNGKHKKIMMWQDFGLNFTYDSDLR